MWGTTYISDMLLLALAEGPLGSPVLFLALEQS